MAEYPARPAGTLNPEKMFLYLTDQAWEGDTPPPQYLYAVMDASHSSGAWDEQGKSRPRRIMASRGLWAVVGDGEYEDCWWWWPMFNSEVQILSTGANPISATGWSAYQEQSQYSRHTSPWGGVNRPPYAVLEIAAWDNNEDRVGVSLGGFSVQAINDKDFDEPGASANHEHAEIMSDSEAYVPGGFASAYHAMWGISDGANKMMYEHRQHNMWPVWGLRE